MKGFQSNKLYDTLSHYIPLTCSLSIACFDFYIISGILQFLYFLYFSFCQKERGEVKQNSVLRNSEDSVNSCYLFQIKKRLQTRIC